MIRGYLTLEKVPRKPKPLKWTKEQELKMMKSVRPLHKVATCWLLTIALVTFVATVFYIAYACFAKTVGG
jgi:hypothetical protein